MRTSIGRLGLALTVATGLAAAGGCAEGDEPVDSHPILVERTAGAFVAPVRVDGEAARVAVIDVLSPLTVLDQDAALAPARRTVDLDLLAPRSATDLTQIVRAQWRATVIDLHPCDPDIDCAIGAAGQPRPIGAIIGADVLRSRAIGFEPATDRIRLLPDVAGDAAARARACDVVVPAPFYGGGTLRLGDTEVGFAGTRIALGVCLSPDPAAATAEERGTDAALVLSTGIGLSILGEARYQAWAAATGGPALDSLPPATALLPSGPVAGRLGRIDRLAIVGTSTAPRGACREVYAHHLLAERDCQPGDDCPCSADEGRSCRVAGIAELTPATPVEVVVVSDQHPLLQALRAELRPDQPEVDGILGMNALAATAFDIDYPNLRLLLRCVVAGCVARPALIDSRESVARCIAAAPT